MSGSGPFQDKPAFRVEALTLERGGRLLFDNLSFAAGPGGYVEIRGANGVGKTSLLRAIAGFLKPKAGRITFDNVEAPALALHYLAHVNALKSTASVRAHLHYWAGLFAGAASDELLGRVGLAGLDDRPARTLSQGQARRLSLSRLLIAPRPIWLLDEPAAALDAAGIGVVCDLIAAHRGRGGIALTAVHEPLGPAPDLIVTLNP